MNVTNIYIELPIMHHPALLWPLGLVFLGFWIGSGRMACWAHGSNTDRWQRRMERMQRRMERMQTAAERWGCGVRERSSGNRAFDEYRAEALRRLEEEQREFMAFLDRLRHARDRAEFDQFIAERGRRSNDAGPQPPP